MGSGASSRARPPTVEAVACLPPPRSSGDCMLYSVMPQGELQKKGDVLVLEVGPTGFRLLKPAGDPIFLWPWGQIHSWAHGPSLFTFRFFDDGKHAIVQHALAMNDVDNLLQHIGKIIDAILADRRKSAITDGDFASLVEALQVMKEDPASQLAKIRTATAANTFTSDQGCAVLKTLNSTFDQIEAAIVLHQRLIDQNRFSTMLEILECQTDRDNVWHRITTKQRHATP